MRAKSRSHEAATVESFRRDPHFAAEYLNTVLEEGDQRELMIALRYMARAFGGVSLPSSRGGVERDHVVSNPFAARQPGTQEVDGFAQSDGHAPCGSAPRNFAIAITRCATSRERKTILAAKLAWPRCGGK